MDVNKANILFKSFFDDGIKLQFDRKATVIKYGEASKLAYYIEAGSVKVVSHNDSGNERVHYLYKKSEIFPLSYILGDKLFDITFMSFTKTTLRAKPVSEFIDFLNKEPPSMMAIIYQQMQVYSHIFNLNLVIAEQRIMAHIITLSERFGEVENNRIIIQMPITIQEFADSVRLSREKTGKVLRRLEDEGYIQISRSRLVVYPEKLKALA